MFDNENNENENAPTTDEMREMISELENDSQIAETALVACCAFLKAHLDMGLFSYPMVNFSALVSALSERLGSPDLESIAMFTEIAVRDRLAEAIRDFDLGEGA